MTVFEADVLFDTIEVTIDCSDNPAWSGDDLHPDITVVGGSE